MICFTQLWGTLLPPTWLNYERWIYRTENQNGAYIDHYRDYQKNYNWPGRDVEQSPIDFIKLCNKDDYYVFISSDSQEKGLEEALTKFDLHKYILYKSPKVLNPTHPQDGPVLTVYVFNFKEYPFES